MNEDKTVEFNLPGLLSQKLSTLQTSTFPRKESPEKERNLSFHPQRQIIRNSPCNRRELFLLQRGRPPGGRAARSPGGRQARWMDIYGSGLRLEPGSRFNLVRGATAQSGAEVRAQREKGLRPGLALAWHVEDFLPVVLVSLPQGLASTLWDPDCSS